MREGDKERERERGREGERGRGREGGRERGREREGVKGREEWRELVVYRLLSIRIDLASSKIVITSTKIFVF